MEARRAGLTRILIAVRSSRGGGAAPSREHYRGAVRALLRSLDRIGYGKSIEAVSAWNEPNLSGATRSRPEVAAKYFDEVRSLCAARGCTPVAGEFADRPADAEMLRRYAAAIPAPAPSVWGWHAYEDGWDRGSDASLPRLRTLLGVIAPQAQVWLTEQGGIVRRHLPGDDGRTQQSAGRRGGSRLSPEGRTGGRSQGPALLPVPVARRAGPALDSGVIAPGGQARVSYCVFARSAAERVPAACRESSPATVPRANQARASSVNGPSGSTSRHATRTASCSSDASAARRESGRADLVRERLPEVVEVAVVGVRRERTILDVL